MFLPVWVPIPFGKTYIIQVSDVQSTKKEKKRFVMGCAQLYGLQPCLPENKFSATMTTTHTALRADKTEQFFKKRFA